MTDYAKLASRFQPALGTADAWGSVANGAGAKYVVLTSRHHDGFTLFDDPGNSFTSTKSLAHRDIVSEYVAAMRRAGLRVGLYYSPLDWRYPGFFFPNLYDQSAAALKEQYHRQLHELASRYGKLDVIWFDGGGANWLGFGGVQFDRSWHARQKGREYTGQFSWDDEGAVADLRMNQPAVLINDRTDAPADFRSREGDQALGDFDRENPWELSTTITEGSWGWEPHAKVKTFDHILRLLVGAAGRDGNLLLNVGPRPDGQIEPEQVARLHEVGEWLRVYGESIYDTRGGPYLPGHYGVSTYRDRTIYLHLLGLNSLVVALPALPAEVTSCKLLASDRKVKCVQTVAGLDITLEPEGSLQTRTDTVVAVYLATPAIGISPISTESEAPEVAPIAAKSSPYGGAD